MFVASRRPFCLVLLLPCLGGPFSPAATRAQQPAAPPAKRADPRPVWPLGRGFRLALTLSRPAMMDEHIEMHVVVTGEQKLDDRDCWSLEFIPVHAPPGFASGGYRVLLDKANGVLCQIAPRLDRAKTLPLPPAGLPFPHEPPEGYPWEVLPFVTAPPVKPGTDGLRLELTRRPEKGHTWYEATIREEGATVLVVKQKWVEGGLWWSEYERWYEGHRELYAELVPADKPIKAIAEQPPPPLTWAQIEPRLSRTVDADTERRLRDLAKMGPLGEQMAVRRYSKYLERKKEKESPKEVESAAKKGPAPVPRPPAPPSATPQGTEAAKGAALRRDPRLQARVNLTLQNPTVEAVLAPLREATGVALTVQEGTVATDRPAFASLWHHESPAFLVMLQLADSAAVRGRWEQTEDGYRLIGTVPPTARDEPGPAPGWSTGKWLIAGNVLVVVFLIGASVWRWRRAKTSGLGQTS
jgi:hypothetical protein